MDMFIEASTAALITTSMKMGYTAWKERRAILQGWAKLKASLLGPDTTIIAIGAGGAGKSTLGRFLAESSDVPPPTPYVQSVTPERKQRNDDPLALVIIAPGQVPRRMSWDGLLNELHHAKRIGIIHVVAYGYQSLELPFEEEEDYVSGMDAAGYLSHRRHLQLAQEVVDVEYLADRIASAGRPAWMVTWANKQDLWWDDRVEMRAHYKQGAYAGHIARIHNALGASRFQHEYVSGAIVQQNLTDGGTTVLKKTTAGYDDQLQFANLYTCLKVVDDLAAG